MVVKHLYYPHVDVSDTRMLKNALLLWDGLETIVPARFAAELEEQRRPLSRELREAQELVLIPRVPTDHERRHAESALLALVDSGTLVKMLSASPPGFARAPYRIFESKFLQSTWWRLLDAGLSRRSDQDRRSEVPAALGFLMMSLLADACAGTQIRKVTDNLAAYSWLAETHASALGAQMIRGFDASQVAPAYDRLVTISLRLVGAERVPLKSLVRLRKREIKDGSRDYAAMRRRFAEAVQRQIERITTEVRSPADLREVERLFQQELRDDLASLKTELRLESVRGLLSRDVATSVLIGAGTFASSIPQLTGLPEQLGLIGVIPLLKAAADLRGTRRAVFRRHIGSWLYLAASPRARLRGAHAAA